jgi:hypothetical protein
MSPLVTAVSAAGGGGGGGGVAAGSTSQPGNNNSSSTGTSRSLQSRLGAASTAHSGRPGARYQQQQPALVAVTHSSGSSGVPSAGNLQRWADGGSPRKQLRQQQQQQQHEALLAAAEAASAGRSPRSSAGFQTSMATIDRMLAGLSPAAADADAAGGCGHGVAGRQAGQTGMRAGVPQQQHARQATQLDTALAALAATAVAARQPSSLGAGKPASPLQRYRTLLLQQAATQQRR